MYRHSDISHLSKLQARFKIAQLFSVANEEGLFNLKEPSIVSITTDSGLAIESILPLPTHRVGSNMENLFWEALHARGAPVTDNSNDPEGL